MIFLEQIVKQCLMEEGQVIVTLEDLQISWEDLERLFIGVYEQAKDYILISDWVRDSINPDPTKKDWTHIKHLTINTGIMPRIMPDIPNNMYEFNPWTHEASALMNTNFTAEVGLHPTLDYLDYSKKLSLTANKKSRFTLPCDFDISSFKFENFTAFEDSTDSTRIILESNNGVGNFNTKTLIGEIIMDIDYTGNLEITSKYMGIKELDLVEELFYTWFKGALLCYIGAMKKQFDLSSVGLPFDINADNLLERGRMLLDKVEDLKGTKQHWSEF